MCNMGRMVCIAVLVLATACRLPGSGPSPTAEPTEEPTPEAPSVAEAGDESEVPEVTVALEAVPPYTVVSLERVPSPTRRSRYQMQLLVSPAYTRDELIAVLVDATRATWRARRNAQATAVFAFSSWQTVGKLYDSGRALATRDGQGWSGDGSFVPFAHLSDRGRILITLGSALTEVEHVTVDIDAEAGPPGSLGVELEAAPAAAGQVPAPRRP